ncbi:LysR family transcriptional regulator [Herbaspirillum autotrophicum]|uniref:LysR family transcriptional regulator n=1 Tax=Herbaspirillum autotrophicum TaxID=180195 RepID=UPI00067D9D08|nr:LysR family transcriptional regulator [Herbaspirillum autotrophicum]
MKTPDLNFLYILQALFDERSVSRAGDRLGLTQPAVSHALGRLREIFQDDLFVRAGSSMAPTPVGEHMALASGRILAMIQHEIWEAQAFDPATTTRTFSVCMSDMGVFALLPRLLSALSEQAPNATLKPIQLPSPQLASALEDGEIDMAIGYLGKMGQNLYQQTLFHRQLVGIARASSTTQAEDMTLAKFISSRHVVADTLKLTNKLLEKELRQHGARLKVGVHVPYLLGVPSVVATSDFISAVPSELAELFSRFADIRVFELPVKIPHLTVKQFWHARHHKDAAHSWFRGLVTRTLGTGSAMASDDKADHRL